MPLTTAGPNELETEREHVPIAGEPTAAPAGSSVVRPVPVGAVGPDGAGE